MANYVPYTGNKDYFEEPQSGNDLVLLFDTSTGSLQVTCILESDIAKQGLVPPSSRLGVTYGKSLDLIKVYATPSRLTPDTVTFFTSGSSGFLTAISDSVLSSAKKLAATAGVTLGTKTAGKILRADFIPDNSAGVTGAVITFLFYI